MTDDLETLHVALVERLDTDEAIRAAFTAHPRHHFIPDMVWPDALGLPLHRASGPDRWTRLVYGSDAVTTQANDGGSGPRNEPSSSSSAPQVMADMIAAAGIDEGMRVLEIGAGTRVERSDPLVIGGREGCRHQCGDRSGCGGPGTGTSRRNRCHRPHRQHPSPRGGIRRCHRHLRGDTGTGTGTGIMVEGGSLILPWSPRPAAQSTPIVALTKENEWLSGLFVREATFMRDRGQRSGELPFPELGRPPVPADTLPIGSVDLIGSGMMTQLLLMMPGGTPGHGGASFPRWTWANRVDGGRGVVGVRMAGRLGHRRG